MTEEIQRRYGSKGTHANAVHPGLIATPLTKHLDAASMSGWAQNAHVGGLMKSTGGIKEGRYLAECTDVLDSEDDCNSEGVGFVPHTYDEEREGHLWRNSLEMVGLVKEMC
jgi:hypothetical protein